MVSLTSQAQKGGTPANPTLYPLPFVAQTFVIINVFIRVCIFLREFSSASASFTVIVTFLDFHYVWTWSRFLEVALFNPGLFILVSQPVLFTGRVILLYFGSGLLPSICSWRLWGWGFIQVGIRGYIHPGTLYASPTCWITQGSLPVLVQEYKFCLVAWFLDKYFRISIHELQRTKFMTKQL